MGCRLAVSALLLAQRPPLAALATAALPRRLVDRPGLHAAVAAQSSFQIAAFHDLVAISGSLIIALAVTAGRLSPDAAFDLSRIDEHWQAELWGTDEDAAMLESLKKQAFILAARFHALCD